MDIKSMRIAMKYLFFTILFSINCFAGQPPLPAQNGNSGKFLTTNGIKPSWATAGSGGTNPAWAGYHNSSCAFLQTGSAAFTTFDGGGASCALVETINSNFVSVASTTQTGQSTPGLVFTPASTGVYNICASMDFADDSSAGTAIDLSMEDGSGTLINRAQSTISPTAGYFIPFTLCGLYNVASLSAVTIYIKGMGASGHTLQLSQTQAGKRAIEWQVYLVSK
jgi:hypothetical protein